MAQGSTFAGGALPRAAAGALAGALLILLLYQIPFRGRIGVGTPWDRWFLSGQGLYPAQHDAGDYRWTAGRATFTFHGLASAGPLAVRLWIAGPEAGGGGPLTVAANGHLLPPVALPATGAPLALAVPADWLAPGGDLTLKLRAPAQMAPGATEAHGFALVAAAVAADRPGPVLPDLGAWGAGLLLGLLAATWRGRLAPLVWLAGSAALAAWVVLARPWFGLHSASLALLAAVLIGVRLLIPLAPPLRRPACWLAGGLLAWYGLLLPGHFYVVDDDEKFAVTASLVSRGTLRLAEPIAGRSYSKYGLGHSLATVPLLAAAAGVEGLLHEPPQPALRELFVTLLNPLCTAATAGLLYVFTLSLWPPAAGRPRQGAPPGVRPGPLVVALLYGLATLSGPHALFAFSEPLLALLLLGSFYGLFRAGRLGGGPGWRLAAGAGLGYLVLTKAEYVLAALALLLYYAWLARGRIATIAPVLAPLALLGAGALAYNALRFGTPWASGYSGEAFSTPLLEGLNGLLISSGKSVFLYSPPLLLSLVGWPRFWRRWRAEAALVLALSGAFLLFYARWWDWSGDWTWGPRFLLPLTPLLALPWGGLYLERPPVRWGVGAVAAGGLFVQALGVLADWRLNFRYAGSGAPYEARLAALHFNPAWSPLVRHAQNLDAGPTSSAVLHLSDFGLPAALSFWAPHLLGAIVLVCLARLLAGAGPASRARAPGPVEGETATS